MSTYTNDISNISDYILKDKIGEGGAGIVYLLEDNKGNSIIKKVFYG